jgi:uncharacterized protein (TIGR00266 family)
MTNPLQFEIAHKPDLAFLAVRLKEGQQIFAEPSAMASMDANVELRSGLKGGVLKSIGRALGGESLVVNTFKTTAGEGEVIFAPGPMGDLAHYRLGGAGLMLQRGAFVAHGEGVEVSAKWQGMKGFFSGEGLVLLKASGAGDLFFNTYGALIELDVRNEYYVDTGYVVAFEDTLSYSVQTVPGLGLGKKVKSFLFGGEGLVCKFEGQGRLWIQTRAVNPFLNWVHPYRPVKKNN